MGGEIKRTGAQYDPEVRRRRREASPKL